MSIEDYDFWGDQGPFTAEPEMPRPVLTLGPMVPYLLIAIIVNSVLFTGGVLLAGIAWHNHIAVLFALCTAALCYFAPVAQMMFPSERTVHVTLVAASVVFGALSFLALVLG